MSTFVGGFDSDKNMLSVDKPSLPFDAISCDDRSADDRCSLFPRECSDERKDSDDTKDLKKNKSIITHADPARRLGYPMTCARIIFRTVLKYRYTP
jgi:hypothetical protein